MCLLFICVFVRKFWKYFWETGDNLFCGTDVWKAKWEFIECFFYIKKSIFWYQKIFFDIKNHFLISEIHFFYIKKEKQFLISENHFLISKNHFLISEIHFWYQKIRLIFFIKKDFHFLISKNIFWYQKIFSDINKSISDIKKSKIFFDIRKSIFYIKKHWINSHFAFHTDGWLNKSTKPNEQGVMILFLFGLSTLKAILSKSDIYEDNKLQLLFPYFYGVHNYGKNLRMPSVTGNHMSFSIFRPKHMANVIHCIEWNIFIRVSAGFFCL